MSQKMSLSRENQSPQRKCSSLINPSNVRLRIPSLLVCLICTLCLHTILVAGSVVSDPDDSLFTPSNQFTVLGPTRFPKPTDMLGRDAEIILQPTFGHHRSDHDAVMAYAEGYELVHYLVFVQTLLDTGFDGDIVLAVSSLEQLDAEIQDFLRNDCATCVVYAVDFTCSADGFATTLNRMQDNGGKMSFQMCKMHHVYGVHDERGQIIAEEDPRGGRVVATLRYELYWIWTTNYDKNRWIMLLDARDAFFQTNPFVSLPRSEDVEMEDGIVYLFGENTNATRLGKSPKNRKWLERGYSMGVMELLKDKPTICSGSTMGEQVALEQYLSAMVNEWDETHIFMKGADQGFHNYLYYTNKMASVREIRSIAVFDQGKGIINNLGALRDLKLSELGLYRPNPANRKVYNWDGSVSPVVHQWDRDQQLYRYTMYQRFPAVLKAHHEKKQAVAQAE